ncbi:MAG: glutamate synthase [Oscillospiraceae bacterium]
MTATRETTINGRNMIFKELNERVRSAKGDIKIKNCSGQRFIGSGESGKIIDIEGTPGNALGAYLDGATIIVHGNAQDATGDTMNCGKIIVHGSCGDATGYAMRGGEIYIKGDVGYRAGIHMKQYKDKIPVIMIGGKGGSFLAEYQAGGIIVVLGLGCDEKDLLGYFCGTGMHGGKVLIRADKITAKLPEQVCIGDAAEADMAQIAPFIKNFSEYFGVSEDEVYSKHFFALTPNTKNPYKQMYVQN